MKTTLKLRIGRDSEKIRNRFQNRIAHDGFNGGSGGSKYPWVKPFWDRDPRWFFQFGWGKVVHFINLN